MAGNPSYLGFYIGIVVQNNDPDKRGRVKVYVPEHGPSVDMLDEILKTGEILEFKFPGNNNSEKFTKVLQDIKNSLPWAEYAGPIFGGSSSGMYNAKSKHGINADGKIWGVEKKSTSFRPANNWTHDNVVYDAFFQSNANKNRFVNEFAGQYTPSNYSGMARGMFSIPNVGAHVYVFYVGSDPMYPVYFAASYGTSDIKRIYTMQEDDDFRVAMDYPAGYENDPLSESPEDRIFRNKTVLNSNKHTIEMIDTDDHEILKLNHYSGSFKEFGNFSNVELATRNDQHRVMGDQFITVGGNRSLYIGNHSEDIIAGDKFITIGTSDAHIVQSILDYHKMVHRYKRLFSVQRTMAEWTPNETSPLQKQVPIGTGYELCPLCGGMPYDPNMMNGGGDWIEAPMPIGDCTGMFMPPTVTFADEAHSFTNAIGVFGGIMCPCCQNTMWKKTEWGSKIITGVALSPSTENGTWAPDPLLLAGGEMDNAIKEAAEKITDSEKSLDRGGDEIIDVSMSKIETIGLAFNDMESFRTDPIGKLKIDGCYVTPQVTTPYYLPAPHVEYVDVVDIPGGDYILTCGNRYKLIVGSRGVSIQTTGPVDLVGTIVNLGGKQMNVTTKNELMLDGGERLTIRARKVTINPVEHNALTIDGQLHVTRNTIIRGGSMFEGEVGLLHVTAPVEWHLTEFPQWEIEPICPIRAIFKLDSGQVMSGELFIPPHKHSHKSIPVTYKAHKNATRAAMIEKGINSRSVVVASESIQNTGVKTRLEDITYDANKKAMYGERLGELHNPEYPNSVCSVFLSDSQLKRLRDDVDGEDYVNGVPSTQCGNFAKYAGTFGGDGVFEAVFITAGILKNKEIGEAEVSSVKGLDVAPAATVVSDYSNKYKEVIVVSGRYDPTDATKIVEGSQSASSSTLASASSRYGFKDADAVEVYSTGKPFSSDIGGSGVDPASAIQTGSTLMLYGRVNSWASSRENLQRDMDVIVSSNVDGYTIEMAGWADSSAWTSSWISKIDSDYKFLLGLCRQNGKQLFVSIVNDNMGTKKYGDHGIKLSTVMSQAKQLCQIVKTSGPGNVFVQPVAETQTSAGVEFESYCRQQLTGFRLIYNGGGGQPKSVPSGYYRRAWHPFKTSDKPPKDSFVVSDTGDIIRQLGNGLEGKAKPSVLESWAKSMRRLGVPLVGYYAFKFNGHDPEAIKALGRAKK